MCQPLRIWIFQNPRRRRPPFWKTVKSQYLYNHLTDFDEIWQGDARWQSLCRRPFKIAILKIQHGTAAILKNRKCAISQQRIGRSRWNLAGLRRFGLSSVAAGKNLNFWKSKMAATTILENGKIAISLQPFDRFWRNLTRWRVLAILVPETI